MSKWIKLKDTELHFLKQTKLHYIKPYKRERTNYWFVEDFKGYPFGMIKCCPRLQRYIFVPKASTSRSFLNEPRHQEELEIKIMSIFIDDQRKKRKLRISTTECNHSKCTADYPKIDDSWCLSQFIKLEDL